MIDGNKKESKTRISLDNDLFKMQSTRLLMTQKNAQVHDSRKLIWMKLKLDFFSSFYATFSKALLCHRQRGVRWRRKFSGWLFTHSITRSLPVNNIEIMQQNFNVIHREQHRNELRLIEKFLHVHEPCEYSNRRQEREKKIIIWLSALFKVLFQQRRVRNTPKFDECGRKLIDGCWSSSV